MNKSTGSNPNSKPRVKLKLGADGQLRSAGYNDHDIGDVWEQQKRIRLQEAAEERRKKAARRQLRKQKGLLGLAKAESSKLLTKTKTELLGEQSVSKPKPTSKSQRPATSGETKTVEVKITMPALPRLNFKKYLAAVRRGFRKISKKVYLGLAAAVIIALIIFGAYHFLVKHPQPKADNAGSQTTTGSQTPKLVRGTPSYSTLLPAGKTADELGGWARVSDPNSDPVYAIADQINGVQISVSEQPLPASLQTDDEIAKLAEGFDANQTFSAGGTTVYIGTSAKGPQSLIMSKDKLLILIKSATIIPTDQWQSYINSLK